MSSKTQNNVRLLVVVDSMDEAVVRDVEEELKQYCPDLSFSPSRETPSLNGCLEFQATGNCTDEQKENMIKNLDNDFDYEEDDGVYSAYSFNTKMFDKRVYYLEMEF